MARFCGQCGKPVGLTDRFCHACGHILGGAKPERPVAAATPAAKAPAIDSKPGKPKLPSPDVQEPGPGRGQSPDENVAKPATAGNSLPEIWAPVFSTADKPAKADAPVGDVRPGGPVTQNNPATHPKADPKPVQGTAMATGKPQVDAAVVTAIKKPDELPKLAGSPKRAVWPLFALVAVVILLGGYLAIRLVSAPILPEATAAAPKEATPKDATLVASDTDDGTAPVIKTAVKSSDNNTAPVVEPITTEPAEPTTVDIAPDGRLVARVIAAAGPVRLCRMENKFDCRDGGAGSEIRHGDVSRRAKNAGYTVELLDYEGQSYAEVVVMPGAAIGFFFSQDRSHQVSVAIYNEGVVINKTRPGLPHVATTLRSLICETRQGEAVARRTRINYGTGAGRDQPDLPVFVVNSGNGACGRIGTGGSGQELLAGQAAFFSSNSRGMAIGFNLKIDLNDN